MSNIDLLLNEADGLISSHEYKKNHAQDLQARIAKIEEEIQLKSIKFDEYLRASTLVGTVSDTTIKNTLKVITNIINKALSVIFPDDPRRIEVRQELYRGVHPHFVVDLYAGVNGKKRSFKQSGTGLGQIISALFTIALIDARKGRQLLIIDEVFNGLHPEAMNLIRDVFKSVQDRYQIIMVEYNMDYGKQYLLKRVGAHSVVEELIGGNYYEELKRIEADRKQETNS